MEFRLLTFTAQDVAVDCNEPGDFIDDNDTGDASKELLKSFSVQMFGINSAVRDSIDHSIWIQTILYRKGPGFMEKSAGGDLVSALRIAIGASGKKSDMLYIMILFIEKPCMVLMVAKAAFVYSIEI